MIKFTNVQIDMIEDYDLLKEAVPANLIDDDAVNYLKRYIGTKCDTIVVEYPYYDGDYLSTYYVHYSMKFRKYEKACCRLHLERGEEYCGFIILRPSAEGTKIGKSYVSPSLLLEKNAYLMLCTADAHVLGQTLEISCFPWEKQLTDISVCAHTALWTIIRYYSFKHKSYAYTTIGDIAEQIENDWGRETPSIGLSPIQVSDLLKKHGFSPVIIDKNRSKSHHAFVDEVIAYVESGIPTIGFLSPQNHALSIMGHGEVKYELLDDPDNVEQLMDKDAKVIPHSRLISSIYVMDDRHFPYREVPIDLPNKDSDVNYGVNEFSYMIVPLYSRMQLAYREVYNRMVSWLNDDEMNWEKLNVCRIYITSANSLKSKTKDSNTMPKTLKDIILTLSMPKFVWCIDFAGIENYKKGLTSGRIIVDTTSATVEKEPWIMRHDMDKVQYKDYDSDPDIVCTLETNISPYQCYVNNLEDIQSKKEN